MSGNLAAISEAQMSIEAELKVRFRTDKAAHWFSYWAYREGYRKELSDNLVTVTVFARGDWVVVSEEAINRGGKIIAEEIFDDC